MVINDDDDGDEPGYGGQARHDPPRHPGGGDDQVPGQGPGQRLLRS